MADTIVGEVSPMARASIAMGVRSLLERGFTSGQLADGFEDEAWKQFQLKNEGLIARVGHDVAGSVTALSNEQLSSKPDVDVFAGARIANGPGNQRLIASTTIMDLGDAHQQVDTANLLEASESYQEIRAAVEKPVKDGHLEFHARVQLAVNGVDTPAATHVVAGLPNQDTPVFLEESGVRHFKSQGFEPVFRLSENEAIVLVFTPDEKLVGALSVRDRNDFRKSVQFYREIVQAKDVVIKELGDFRAGHDVQVEAPAVQTPQLEVQRSQDDAFELGDDSVPVFGLSSQDLDGGDMTATPRRGPQQQSTPLVDDPLAELPSSDLDGPVGAVEQEVAEAPSFILGEPLLSQELTVDAYKSALSQRLAEAVSEQHKDAILEQEKAATGQVLELTEAQKEEVNKVSRYFEIDRDADAAVYLMGRIYDRHIKPVLEKKIPATPNQTNKSMADFRIKAFESALNDVEAVIDAPVVDKQTSPAAVKQVDAKAVSEKVKAAAKSLSPAHLVNSGSVENGWIDRIKMKLSDLKEKISTSSLAGDVKKYLSDALESVAGLLDIICEKARALFKEIKSASKDNDGSTQAALSPSP